MPRSTIVPGPQARDVLAVEHDAPGVGPQDLGDQAQQRGLAGAVRADQADDLIAAQREAHVVDGREAAEALGQAFDGEELLSQTLVSSRNSRRETFPTSVLGSSPRNSTMCGTLYSARLLPAVGLDLVFRQLAARVALQHHDRLDALADRRVGHADHARGLHLRVRVKHVLDVLGEDRVALELDQVLGAVVEVEVALAVHAHQIAGAHPAHAALVDERARAFLGPLPVALHDVRAAEHELPGLAGRHELERIGIHDRRLHARNRAAERAGLRAVQRVHVARGAGLRQAIALDDVGAGALRPALHRRFVQRVGPREHQLQALPVGLVGVLVVLEVLVERRHAIEHSRAVALHRFEDRLGVRAGEEHQQVPLAQALQHDHDLAVDMEERQEGEDHLLALLEDRERRLRHGLRRDQVVVREHHALRVAGGAAGVGQRREVGFRVDRHRRRLRRIFLQQVLQPVDLARDLGLLREQALERRQVLVDVGHHHEIQLRARLRHLLVQDVLADDRARAAVLELVAHLVAGVDRADRRHGGAALERGEVRDDELRTVEQVERDARRPSSRRDRQARRRGGRWRRAARGR